ncbi:GNAT family N-acetyltransferase [Lacticigenium naphthae]|uniref:GNAT family N-acetyltransferase n=1 Tax=Lacticigenium naphthae TaxID=515351 RepID=UPI0003F645FE|nr:GNAT family N-acetyltransferase [Lacticigenium naphthae]
MEEIRKLSPTDKYHYAKMETDLPTDYMLMSFERISSDPNTLYGLFLDDKLVCIGGYTLFGTAQIMLGRLRTDKNYRRKKLAFKLMRFILNEIRSIPEISWIGGYTEVTNIASRNLQKQLGLVPMVNLYHTNLPSVPTSFLSMDPKWIEIKIYKEKLNWLKEAYIEPMNIIPYECYYPLPSSLELFTEQQIENWTFYRNASESRLLILKPDYKGKHYVHILYPYDDLMGQKGLWNTIDDYYHQYVKQTAIKPSLWLDIDARNMNDSLFEDHLASSTEWVLSGSYSK